jgi:hypothetical protein
VADYQRGGTWWSAGDPTKLVVPPGVNKVRIRGSAQFNPAGGTASFNITVQSDVANIPGFRQISQVLGGFSWSGAGSSGEIDVVPGNYFQFSVYQNTAGNLALAETNYTWFEIEAIEDYSASIPGSIKTPVYSDVTGVPGADMVTNIMSLTQAEYDAIVAPDASTLYMITE